MKISNIEFVAWTLLSDAFENMATLLKNRKDKTNFSQKRRKP